MASGLSSANNRLPSVSGRSSSSSPSVSPSLNSSSYDDDSSEIDELEHRSRRLTNLLKNNVEKATGRQSLLDVVKRRAWLLDNQVNQLERQTLRTKRALGRQSFQRRMIMFGAFMSSVVLLGLGVNHIAHNSKE